MEAFSVDFGGSRA